MRSLAGAIAGRAAAVPLALAATALLAGAPAGAAAAPTGLPACALGRLPAALRTTLPAEIAAAQRRFGASLHGVGAADRRRAETVFATGLAAYAYGLPPVVLRLTVQRFPRNQFVGIAQLADAGVRAVVAPNHDTLYSVSQVDLSNGPVVIDAPATGGRYSILQLLDAYTNDFAYVGAGAERESAEVVALVPPGWQGVLPPGVRRVDSPTNLVWLLGRTLIDGPRDLPPARAVLSGYALTPLDAWLTGSHGRPTILDAFPGNPAPVTVPTGTAFFDALGADLAADPAPARDACALQAFARAGIAPGATPSSTADAQLHRALSAAAAAGARLVDRAAAAIRRDSQRRNNGWAALAGDTGRFGTDYASRAVVARVGLGANTPQQALYPNTDTDARGRVLRGDHDYVVTFRPGGLPPVRAFWSLTLYGADRYLVPNPIDRFAIGDRTPGLRYGRRRSLRIVVSHSPPRGAQRANWLPAPRGRFLLYLRLYEPKPVATARRWKPPTVTRTR
jgi:hypothetical protein